jgi:Uma2 family endonuclease
MIRFSVDQYHMMIDHGILGPQNRVELLEGWIVGKMPHKPPHDGTIGRINRRLMRLLPDEWLLRVQSAITLRDSEPEPDLVVTRGPEEIYFKRHPMPGDIALVIEVADSSLIRDREVKIQIYARARIPLYWIVDISAALLHVYRLPRGGKSPGYREHVQLDKSAMLPLVLGGVEVTQVSVRDLLP